MNIVEIYSSKYISCPLCGCRSTYDEWDKSTRDDFNDCNDPRNIVDLKASFEKLKENYQDYYFFTCPSCGHEVCSNDICDCNFGGVKD